MSRVFLLLGGNAGNTKEIFLDTITLIEKRVGKIIQKSSIYKTEPWGFKSEEYFLNQAIEISTRLSPQDTLKELLSIEQKIGRVRTSQKYESRMIDIDILLFDNNKLDEEDLQIPHPRMHLRNFTLYPLAEIAGKIIHPTLNTDIETLKQNCKDKQKVKIQNEVKA